jgi:AraC-like DNA-binding protein
MVHEPSYCADRRVARAVSYVSQDLTRRVTLSEAASVAGLDPIYFSKRFRKTVGLTFGLWSVRLRIEKSKLLLRMVDLSVTAIAANVGYDDLTTFARAFRRVEGIAPREYRRHLLNKGIARKTENAESATRNAETEL